MVLKSGDIKRLGIFFFYDSDGIVDDYVLFYLKSMLKHLNKLIVVCNGKLTIKSRNIVESLENTIVLVRENKGFDVWAYKTGLEYLGWDEVSSFDELIMFNFTIMGPVCDLKDMFETMDSKEVDFWGLTIHNGASFDPWGLMEEGSIPVHIQSHFIAVRQKMLRSFEFQKYWEQMPMIKRYEEAVGLHEAVFTKRFEDYGYKWCVYIDTEDLLHKTFYPLFNMPVEMIRDRKCPFFKRKIFIYEWESSINENAYTAAAELYGYLKNETDYDVSMLIRHIMRTGNLHNFVNAMNLYETINNYEEIKIQRKVAVIVNSIINEDMTLEKFLNIIPAYMDIYVLTMTETDKEKITIQDKAFTVIKKEHYLDELKILINLSQKYEYICLLEDIEGDYLDIQTNIRSFALQTYKSMIDSEAYINGVIRYFEEEDNLGVMLPYPPVHSEYFGILGNEWGTIKNFDNVKKLLDQLDCSVMISYDIPPVISISGCMWIRSSAISGFSKCKLINTKEMESCQYIEGKETPRHVNELCQGIKYLVPYMAQSEGYFSTFILNKSITGNVITNLSNSIFEINKSLHNLESEFSLLCKLETNFIKADINFNAGDGYYKENMISTTIMHGGSYCQDLWFRFKVMPGTKEIVMNLGTGLMVFCKNMGLFLCDMQGKLIQADYRLDNNATMHLENGLDMFFGCVAEYRIMGELSRISEIIVHIEEVAFIRYFDGIDNVLNERKKNEGRRRWIKKK